MKKKTISDVAKEAGVSIKTVSRVINNEPNVRPEKQKKVRAVIAKLNYSPTPSARRLAGSRCYVIGLVYSNPSPYYISDIQAGAVEVCRAQGYDILIHPCNYKDPHIADELALLLAQKKVDGLVLTPPLSDMYVLVRALQEQGVPFVSITPDPKSRSEITVCSDERTAAANMTRYLISIGHRRIGFIEGHPDHKGSRERMLGYKEMLVGNGIPLQPDLVKQGYFSFESGEQCGRELLQMASPPTAIFAGNDDMAIGAMKIAHEMGLHIPRDISIVGFDDTPIAGQVWPRLTTVRQPIQRLSATAVFSLVAHLRGHPVEMSREMIECEIILRESAAAVAANS